jgi:peptidoglycan-associated lipoprotein
LRSIIPLLFVGFAVFAVAGCPNPEWPKCENDDHCKGDKDDNPSGQDMVCVFGQCQECGRDSDCAAGSKCRKGRCDEVCVSDKDCSSGERCNAKGDCEQAPDDADPNACVEDGDCKSGFNCVNKTCVQATSSDPVASVDCDREGRVHFEFNVYDLTPEARETLDRFAKCMQSNPTWKLTVEGHCDERGTTQYNLDLGDKRARAVAEYLGRLGVDRARLRTVSYGEERPLDNAGTESAWAQNRRGELIVK